jgi:hypothetical protein
LPALKHAFAPAPAQDANPAPALSAVRPTLSAAPDFHNSTANLSAAPTRIQSPAPAAAEDTTIRSDRDLVVRLCQMPVHMAAHLLRASLPALDAQALLALIAATGEAHHRLIAQRPGLDWRVVKALLRSNSDEVLLALAENHHLDFDDDDQAQLARMADDRIMLRAAILANPALTKAGAHVKLNIDDGLSHKNLKLVKLLRAGQSNAFVIEAANRLDWEPTRLQRVLARRSAAPLALLLCSLGLDRTVFANLIGAWQAANGGEPYVSPAHKPVLMSVFGLRPDAALQKLSAIAGH